MRSFVLILVFVLAFSPAASFAESPAFDLLQIKHLNSKGRVQDQLSNPVVEEILAAGPGAIPLLIDLIESERPYKKSPLDFWPQMREGDMALVILSDLFLGPTWKRSTLPELCWDNLLERPGPEIPAWLVLDKYINTNGRAGLANQWRKIWSTHRDEAVWDDEGRYFRIAGRKLVVCVNN